VSPVLNARTNDCPASPSQEKSTLYLRFSSDGQKRSYHARSLARGDVLNTNLRFGKRQPPVFRQIVSWAEDIGEDEYKGRLYSSHMATGWLWR
jgi:hypothetical protein